MIIQEAVKTENPYDDENFLGAGAFSWFEHETAEADWDLGVVKK